MAWRHLERRDIEIATADKRRRVDSVVATAQKFLLDPDAVERRNQASCPCCYYASGKLAGQAMTLWKCRVCDAEQTHLNTNTPVVCWSCAREHELCRWCAADVDLRTDRQHFRDG